MKNEAIFSTFTIFRKLPTTTKSCSNQFQFNIVPKLVFPQIYLLDFDAPKRG